MIEQALYEDRALIRMLGMRRTMFVVAADFMPVVQAACTDEIALRQRRRYVQLLAQGGIAGDVAPGSRMSRNPPRGARGRPRRSPGLVIAGDEETVPGAAPWVALLPALDPTVMGWRDRHWFLGGHRTALTDRSGNIGPTVWWDGRVVGGWAQRAAGEIVFRLLEDMGADAVGAVTEEAERLRGWIGSVRVTPRFRTPLERDLSG